MKYMILIHHNPANRELWERLPADQRAADMEAYAALTEELAASGELIVTEALADASQTKRVTVGEGRTITSDGPFAEVKEQLAGFFLVECESIDRAVEIASRLPDAPVAQIEVSPVLTFSAQEM